MDRKINLEKAMIICLKISDLINSYTQNHPEIPVQCTVAKKKSF